MDCTLKLYIHLFWLHLFDQFEDLFRTLGLGHVNVGKNFKQSFLFIKFVVFDDLSFVVDIFKAMDVRFFNENLSHSSPSFLFFHSLFITTLRWITVTWLTWFCFFDNCEIIFSFSVSSFNHALEKWILSNSSYNAFSLLILNKFLFS